MLRQGQRVSTLTKKTGQTPRAGTVKSVRDGFVVVEWDDGRTTTISAGYLVPEKRQARSV